MNFMCMKMRQDNNEYEIFGKLKFISSIYKY